MSRALTYRTVSLAVAAMVALGGCKRSVPDLERAVRAALDEQSLSAAKIWCDSTHPLGLGEHGQCSVLLTDGHELTVDVENSWVGSLSVDTHVHVFDLGRECETLSARREYAFDCAPGRVPMFSAATFSFPFEGPRGHGVVTVDVDQGANVIAVHWP
jgi:hypothetical protein